jgi:hypothetical protein
MSSTIKIKRSEVAGNPAVLGAGELAYSGLLDNGVNGGDRLYVGMGTETAGNAVNHVVIGGKYFTDMLDHTKGVLTASSSIITDSNKKIDQLLVDNIDINGNSIGATDLNGDLGITGNGNGRVLVSNAYKLPNADGALGYVMTTDGSGNVTWNAAASNLSISGNTGTDTLNLLTDSLAIVGSGAISTALNPATNSVGITVANATDTTVGVASFSSSDFTVVGGAVSLNSNAIYGAISSSVTGGTESGIDVQFNPVNNTINFVVDDLNVSLTGAVTSTVTSTGPNTSVLSVAIPDGTIANAKLSNSSVTVGTTQIALGTSALTLAGIQSLDVDNININGNTIGATDTNGNLSLAANGTGTIAANNFRISGLAEPVNPNDAATKAYVDARSAGLDPKASVRVATTENVALSGTPSIDGVSIIAGNRVLVKNQTTASQNGIYVAAAGAWARSSDFDEDQEATAGVFFFVEEGLTNGDAGFVLTTNNQITIGVSELTFTQFSGAGQIVAGDGLGKSGNELFVNVAGTGGIEIVADSLQLKSSLAGAGLTYLNGVLNLVGTSNRITVNTDSIDIAGTYIGQTSITTLGTITTGVWNGTAISPAYGGIGLTSFTIGDLLVANGTDSFAKLGLGINGKILQSNGTGLVYADIDGGIY